MSPKISLSCLHLNKKAFMKAKKNNLSLVYCFTLLKMSFQSPASAGTCDNHRGRRAVLLRMSLEKHVGDNDGARERRRRREKRKEKEGP